MDVIQLIFFTQNSIKLLWLEFLFIMLQLFETHFFFCLFLDVTFFLFFLLIPPQCFYYYVVHIYVSLSLTPLNTDLPVFLHNSLPCSFFPLHDIFPNLLSPFYTGPPFSFYVTFKIIFGLIFLSILKICSYHLNLLFGKLFSRLSIFKL
jgi:hypothetical protein